MPVPELSRKSKHLTVPALMVLGGAALARQHLEKRSLQRENQRLDKWLTFIQEGNEKLHRDNEELQYKATHDTLTGLLNKETGRARIEERRASGKPFGVIFMDMNAFKAINDMPGLGHEVGDKLLANFGMHLRERFHREDDTLTREAARYGGDEFGFIVDLDTTLEQRAQTPQEQMARTIDHLREVVDEFAASQDAEILATGFGFALGGAIWSPENPLSTSDLLRQADAAMYEDKRAQGGGR